jgi:hypothetical protein
MTWWADWVTILGAEGVDNCITICGYILGTGAFIIGLWQYRKGQKWKRAEFVADLIEKFESQPKVKNTMMMLDWNSRDIKFQDQDEPLFIEDSMLGKALAIQTPTSNFADAEVEIRDAFDEYLDGLVRFEHYIEIGLLNEKELRPFLIYWIKLIGDKDANRKPHEVTECIWRFINGYGYEGVQKLCKMYGYDITKFKENP